MPDLRIIWVSGAIAAISSAVVETVTVSCALLQAVIIADSISNRQSMFHFLIVSSFFDFVPMPFSSKFIKKPVGVRDISPRYLHYYTIKAEKSRQSVFAGLSGACTRTDGQRRFEALA